MYFLFLASLWSQPAQSHARKSSPAAGDTDDVIIYKDSCGMAFLWKQLCLWKQTSKYSL